MKRKRASKKKVNRALAFIFDKSSFMTRPSKFDTTEQQFIIENYCGRLECKYDAQAAAKQIDSILFSQFLEHHQHDIEVIELRHKGQDSYLQDEGLKTLLAHSKEERKKYVPIALSLLAEQLQANLEAALKKTVNAAAVQAIHMLEEQTLRPTAHIANEL